MMRLKNGLVEIKKIMGKLENVLDSCKELNKKHSLVEEIEKEWSPSQGEEVWIKVFSNWSFGTYIGYDVVKKVHFVREDEQGGGHLFCSDKVLPYYSMPNEPNPTIEDLKINQYVYHKDIYWGRQEMKIVGLRENEVELEGDYSGGTHNSIGKQWFPIEGLSLTKMYIKN
jgi:hypothetical protein